MRRIPGARDVDTVLKQVAKTVKNCLEDLQQEAAKAIAKGRYEVAEQFISKGREIQGFLEEVEDLRKRWRTLKGGRSRSGKAQTTPQWKYYRPILMSLMESGGEATAAEIEPAVHRTMQSNFLPGDTEKLSAGRMRWQIMIRRSRKHLVKEEWIKPGSGRSWCITPAGEKMTRSARAE